MVDAQALGKLSAMEKVLSIYELIEHIILQLKDPVEIIRVQRVCRAWRDIIQTSPALQSASWSKLYNTVDTGSQPVSSQSAWRLNPAFNRLGVSVSTKDEEARGSFSLMERIYDKPGSWATLPAIQPASHKMLIQCYGDYSHDETIFYLVTSMTGHLLMGDIMAVLAECQNGQECGLDRWGGVRHYTGHLLQLSEREWGEEHWQGFETMPNDVSIKVAVELPWGAGGYPAFSLRRVDNSKHFLHEMILHKMILIHDGREYQWEGGCMRPVCKKGEYKANLLVIREYQEGYLSDCGHIFRLLSDVE